eukprot:TRINITY_DN11364_c0_g1_i1.p1 TRINITY_DN11364_c0_g1~~TRINITY_DN11364_c0_g1_i1.p1  ORF type:complete len:272 (-),score=11.97 TRINITY_DN11364_c0_g1_i1:28-753(-)
MAALRDPVLQGLFAVIVLYYTALRVFVGYKETIWSMVASVTHAFYGVIAGCYIFYAYLPSIKHVLQDRCWYEIRNVEVPYITNIFMYSAAYFVADTVDLMFTKLFRRTPFPMFWAYTLHHLVVLFGYFLSMYFGEHLLGFMTHFFFAELGNLLLSSRAAGLLGKEVKPQLWDGLITFMCRLTWTITYMVYFQYYLLFQCPKWGPLDYHSFIGGTGLIYLNLFFAWKFLEPNLRRKKKPHTS